MRWTTFPDRPIKCSGLPWLDENLPDLWRLPKRMASALPVGVQQQMRFPGGGVLRLRSDTSELRFRIQGAPEGRRPGLDVYVDGQFWGTAKPSAGDEVIAFEGTHRRPKSIAIYLPVRHELQIREYGLDSDARSEAPVPLAREHPLVLYGSSVAQGIGSARPGLSYAAILGRSMNTNLVNLGFGGAGKAEPEIATLVAQIDACGYLLDLGKSYGRQSAGAYAALLTALRDAHPDTPIVCITPIFSSREFHNEDYLDLSLHTRTVMREAAKNRLARGDSHVILVDGETLLSADDVDGLTGDQVHPNDLGHSLIARRLQPVVEKALQAGS